MNLSEKKIGVQTWRNDAYLSFYKDGIIPKEKAIDYFCNASNPFYEKTCANEVVRMQRRDPSEIIKREGVKYLYESTTGKRNEIHIIAKYHTKRNPQSQKLQHFKQDLYYIVHGNVYLSPTYYQVIQSRIYNLSSNLVNSFNLLCKNAKFSESKKKFVFVKKKGVTRKDKRELRKDEKQRMLSKFYQTSRYGKIIDEHVNLTLDVELSNLEEKNGDNSLLIKNE